MIHRHHRHRDLPHIPSSNASTKARYDYYSGLVTANGGKMEDGVDTILGLRGLAPNGKRHDSAENVGPYNDTFVILHKDADGTPHVSELQAQTHAGQKSSSIPKDGVAQIRPGTYQAVPNGPHNDMASWHILTTAGDGQIPAWRDTDKDGYISAKEKKHAESTGCTATEILFHNGKFEDHGSSIGCQVMPPKVMGQFIKTVGEQSHLNYTLIDANLATPGHHH